MTYVYRSPPLKQIHQRAVSVVVLAVVLEKLRVVVVVVLHRLMNLRSPQPRVHGRRRLHPSSRAAHASAVKKSSSALLRGGF